MSQSLLQNQLFSVLKLRFGYIVLDLLFLQSFNIFNSLLKRLGILLILNFSLIQHFQVIFLFLFQLVYILFQLLNQFKVGVINLLVVEFNFLIFFRMLVGQLLNC